MPSKSGLPEVDLERLCLEVEPRALALFSRGGVSPDAADDLFQDCLVRLLQVQYEVRDASARLLSALRYAILMFWRSERARVTEQLSPAVEATLGSRPPADANSRIDLERAVAKLSRDQKELLALRYHHGLEPAEIARMKGCSTRNVRKRTALCLRVLRTRLVPRTEAAMS
jgi:RNA polymerase sigma factor (sigma-70 family)